MLEGQSSPGDPFPVLIGLGHHCSDQEQNAESAEREVTKIKLLHYLNKKIGESMKGVISGVVPEGFYVRGTEIPAEGFVPWPACLKIVIASKSVAMSSKASAQAIASAWATN